MKNKNALIGILLITCLQSMPALGESPKTYDTGAAFKRHDQLKKTEKSCGNGVDFYDGGEGIDTIGYKGKRADYFIMKHSDGSYTVKDQVPCRADTDTVINIERFVFSDGERSEQTLAPNSNKP